MRVCVCKFSGGGDGVCVYKLSGGCGVVYLCLCVAALEL